MKRKVALSLDEKLVKDIDKKRGLVSRSKYINELLFIQLKGGKKR